MRWFLGISLVLVMGGGDVLRSVLLGVMILLSFFLERIVRVEQLGTSRGPGLNQSTLWLGIISGGILLFGWASHSATSVTSDELCSVRQAMAFESGRVTLPIDFFGPHIDPTSVCFARSSAGFFSIQGPGWPAVLAAMSVSGFPQEHVPWLLAVATLFVIGLVGVLSDGLLLGVVLMVSLWHNQFFDTISRSFWSHSLAILCVAVILLGLISSERLVRPRAVQGCYGLAGLAAGMLLLTRPLVGLSAIASVLLGLVCFPRGNGVKDRLTEGAIFSVGPFFGVILYGLFNQATTGSFFLSGYEYLFGAGHNPGFFSVSPNGVVHSPERAWMLLRHHVGHLLLFVVPTGGFLVGTLILGVGFAWSRPIGHALLMTFCLWFGAATYWDSSYFVGPRFYYESLIPLTLLVFGVMRNGIRVIGAKLSLASPVRGVEALVFLLVALLTLPAPPIK